MTPNRKFFKLTVTICNTRFPDFSALSLPLKVWTAELKKASEKRSREPEKTTRALLRACKPAIWKQKD